MCDGCDYSDDDESHTGDSWRSVLEPVPIRGKMQIIALHDAKAGETVTVEFERALLAPTETYPDVRPRWRRALSDRRRWLSRHVGISPFDRGFARGALIGTAIGLLFRWIFL